MRITQKLPLYAVLMLAAVLQLLLATESRADFFKYKDDSGAIVIKNRLEDVPKKYRDRVKVVWDSDLEAKDPVAKRKAAAREEYEKQDAAGKAQQQADEKKEEKKKASKGKTLVIELDENTGQLIRRFE
jgi:hypothetical protein